MSLPQKIALVGNPNSGKSSLFNQLTGLRQRIGNFPGVTVDRSVGTVALGPDHKAQLIDLPGIYSLYPHSQDEEVATEILLDPTHRDHPDVVVLVADATNLRRSLLLCTQVMDLGLPVVLALNMSDLVDRKGLVINRKALSKQLGIPVVSISALKRSGLPLLQKMLSQAIPVAPRPVFRIPAEFDKVLEPVMEALGTDSRHRAWQALLMPEEFRKLADKAGIKVMDNAKDMISNELAVRYDHIRDILDASTIQGPNTRKGFSQQLDRVLLHPVAGYLIFVSILFLVFQAIFAWASWPMDMIEQGFGVSGEWFRSLMPEGATYSSLLVDGIWAGLGGIVIYVPQIAILFFFISLLEGSGYMSRVVFLMDRIMSPFGFSGKSVIPLVGGMACAIPSIMMVRSIPNKTERLITIMVTPLMSCSARIPVYVLLISLFVPEDKFFGIFSYQGLIMTGMYFLGFFMALAVAWVIKTITRYKSTGMFVTELPLYRIPPLKNTLLEMYHKSRTFVIEAGRVILVISILLWGLANYGPSDKMANVESKYNDLIEQAQSDPGLADPGRTTKVKELEAGKASEKLRASYAGMIGQGIEPAIRPLGFDWKIGISLLSSFAAREVFVGTMATIYSAGNDAIEDEDGRYRGIRDKMKAEVYTDTGEPVYTTAVAVSLLLFYAFAMQCMSTLAVVKKETRSWKTTFIMLFYMTGLAYLASLTAYQVLS